jgi:rhodanese-related sulfurtransferase
MGSIFYLILGVFVGYTLFKKFIISRTDFKKLIEAGAIIIDVRSEVEFSSGHIQGSINIPLQILPSKLDELKAKNVKIIACCASGMRSGSACGIMKAKGIDCVNGGGWNMLGRKIN